MHTKNSLIVAMLVGSQVVGSTHAARTDDRRASIVTAEQGGEDRPQDRFLNSNDIRIRYVDEGDGPAVVLVHGYLGNIERHWIKSRVFADLVKDHRVVALDCQGHGKSDKPARPDAYGAEMGKDIVRLLDHLHIARAHIVGFSMGAIIAGHLLTTDPDRFLSATLVAHHPVHAWTGADARDAEAEARDLESDTPFRSLILGISSPDAIPPEVEIRKLSRELAAANDVKALAAYHRGRGELATTDEALAAVRVPTLGIIGSADPALADLKEAKKVMAALSTVVVIDGATHGGESGVLRRREFLTALREFLSQHESLVIADFEGDKAEARTGLSLWPYADEQFGGTSEARVTLIHPGAEGSKSAVRVSFLVTDDSPTPFAGAWAMIGPEGLATDVSAYRGVRFHARGKDQTAFTFGIVRFPGQIRRYMAPFEVRPEWTRIELPFEKFVLMNTLGQTATDTTRLDAKDITSIGVSVAPRLRGRFEIDIDQLELYR